MIRSVNITSLSDLSLGPDAAEYILIHSNVRAVVVSVPQLPAVLQAKANILKNGTDEQKQKIAEFIIVMNDTEGDRILLAEWNKNKNALTYTHLLSDLEHEGQKILKSSNSESLFTLGSPESVYTICYTSGTTGNPKGVVLTNQAMISACAGMALRLPTHLESPTGEVTFSYLPLAHIYERVAENALYAYGHAIGFFQGDTLKLVDDVAELQPSVFPGVPRVWQRIYDRVTSQVSSSNAVSRSLFARAFASRLQSLDRYKPLPLAAPQGEANPGRADLSFLENLVLSKIAQRTGGKVKLMSTGAG